MCVRIAFYYHRDLFWGRDFWFGAEMTLQDSVFIMPRFSLNCGDSDFLWKGAEIASLLRFYILAIFSEIKKS